MLVTILCICPVGHAAKAYVLAADGLNDIVWWRAKELGDDGELIDVVLAGEEWLSLEHLGKDAASTPDIYLDVVLLPCEHNLGGTVVTRGHVTRHLRVLNTSQAEVANLEITVLIDEDIGWL